MKYCVSSRQPKALLEKVDEIKIELRDYKAIPDFIDKYPEKTLILDMTYDIPEGFNWDMIKVYSDKMEGRFYCALVNLGLVNECKNRGIKFYYKYSATSMFELQGLKDLGVSYIVVGTPLMFNLKKVKSYGIPLRAVPNLAYENYIPHQDGIIGGWVRPEDVSRYELYIDVFEFYHNTLEKEATLYHVYAENGKWPGNLALLIDYLGVDFDNKVLYDTDNFAIRRMNCGQKCLNGYACHYCASQLKFEQILKQYQEQKSNI